MDWNPPLVSIITPSFNQARFLEQTIQSVVTQDYPNLEYIVIDGGSTDGSVEIIRKYSDRISYWISRKDNGQAEAINEGFKRATGKYIAWLNSDDLYLPGCIQTAVKALENAPDAAMAFGQVDVINEQGRRVGMFRPVSYQFENLLTYKIILPQQAAFFRRQILDKIGVLNTNLHFALDHEFFLRIGAYYPITDIPNVIAQYRLSSINKGTTLRYKWAEEFVRVLDIFFLHSETQQMFFSLKKQAYAGAYYSAACSLLDDGSYSQSRHSYRAAVSRHIPFLFTIRWWIGFIRTFLGRRGNTIYLSLKVWMAQKNLLDVRYDWWTNLKIIDKQK